MEPGKAARSDVPGGEELPFIGRTPECAEFLRILHEARASRGSAWVIEGSTGIGKSRLARQVQEKARAEGFDTRWGYCLKEVNTSLFPFLQLFHRREGKVDGGGPAFPTPLPSVLIVEEDKPTGLLSEGAGLARSHPMLVISRDRPATLRERYPALTSEARLHWLTRMESPDAISPSNLDALGERLASFYQERKGGIVLLTAIEYLVTQNGFPAVLRLLQYLRDVAEESNGHLLISVNPGAFESRERNLLEGEGEVIGALPTEDSERPSTPPTPTEAMMQYLDMLDHDSRTHPQLLVIDDLQWADPDSLRTFQFLARNVRNLGVVLVATLQTDESRSPEEVREGHQEDILEAMNREGTLRRIVLHGLEGADAEEFVSRVLGMPLSTSLDGTGFQHLLERSGGSPFILRELARHLSEDGLLRIEDGHATILRPSALGERDTPTPFLPESIQRLVSREISALPPEDRKLLEWASIIGGEFDLAPLAGVTGMREEALAGEFHRLERNRKLLVRSGKAFGERRGWSFSPHLVQEVILARMDESTRASQAARLAQWWSQNRADEVETIARLYHNAGQVDPGLDWIRRAMHVALQARSLETVGRYHRWLQEFLDASGATNEARVREGLQLAEDLEMSMGSSTELVRLLQSLLELDLSPSLRWEVQAHLAVPLANLNPKEARPLIEELRKIGTDAGGLPVSERFRIDLAETMVAVREGNNAEVHRSAQRLLHTPHPVPAWTQGRALYYSAVALCHLNAIAEASQELVELRALDQGHPEANLRVFVAGVDSFIGEFEGDVGRQCRASREAITALKGRGNPQTFAIGWNNLAEALIEQGSLQEARACAIEARKLIERFDLPLPFIPHSLEAALALRDQRWSEVIPMYEQVIQELTQQGNFEVMVPIHLRIAEANLFLSDLERAKENLRRASPTAEALASISLPFTYHYLAIEAMVLDAEGNASQARASLLRAATMAETARNLFWQGLIQRTLAQWEERHGDADAARNLFSVGDALLTRAGVLPDGWPRAWPPSWPHSGAPAPAHTAT